MNLKDVFDQDSFVINNQQYTDDDLQRMSLDDLETLKMRVNKENNCLSASIREKQIDYSNGGKGSTPEWFKKRRDAFNVNQQFLTYLNYLIKKRLRSGRKLSDYFMDVAKDRISRDLYEIILNEAYNEMEKRQKENGKQND